MFTLLILSLLIGCQVTDEMPANSPFTANLAVKGEFYIIKIQDNNPHNYTKEESWSEYIEDIFGIKIRMSFIYRDSNNPYAYSDLLSNKANSGLVYFNNPGEFTYMARTGALMELDSYFSSTNIGMLYNFNQKDTFRYDGATYGIPTDWNIMHYSRYYQKEYIDTLGIGSAKDINTINKFTEFIQRVTYEDPNKNGTHDTPGLCIFWPRANEALPDVQKAFGCYFPFDESHAVSFNPHTDSFEDCAFSSEITAYIGWLDALKDAGIMATDVVMTDYPGISKNSMLPTQWGRCINFVTDDNHTAGSQFLEGVNTQYLYENRQYRLFGCYGLLAGTENPEEYIGLLTEEFMRDDRYYLALKFGIPDEDYKIYGDVYVSYVLDGEMPDISAPHTNEYMQYASRQPSDSAGLADLKSEYNNINNEYHKIMEELNFSMMYSLPYIKSEVYLQRNDILHTSELPDFNMTVLNQVLNNGTSVNDALYEYRIQFLNAGYDMKLKELNESIGCTTYYDYKVD